MKSERQTDDEGGWSSILIVQEATEGLEECHNVTFTLKEHSGPLVGYFQLSEHSSNATSCLFPLVHCGRVSLRHLPRGNAHHRL